jgi:glutamine synthetase
MCDGTGVDGSSLGFLTTEQSDMKVAPDPSSSAVLPWDKRTTRFICNIMDNDGSPHFTCPRTILRRVMSKAEEKGYNYKTRPELEWYYVNSDAIPADYGGYMDTVPYDSYGYLRRSTIDDLQAMGVAIKTIHHEHGPGQQEFEFVEGDALKRADDVQTAKMVVKTKALMEDVIATFMPKPIPEEAGSGLHIHQYLTRGDVNLFGDPDKGVSEFLVHFVGGIMDHVDAMTAFLNPTINSYKRLVPGHEAPVYKSWGVANRTALIRVPGYEKKAHVEYRAPDCSTNIYLASALLLAAGLDGVERKKEPMPPTKENVEKMTIKQRKELGITQLPSSLGDALDNLESSSFVIKVLGKDIVSIFLDKKRCEIQEYLKAEQLGKSEARAWEIKNYLERC